MKYYKNELNQIFAFDDYFSGVPEELVSVTESEAMLVVNPPLTDTELLEQAKASMESAVQNHIDSQAQSLGYDNIVSACSYAGYINEFQTEAISLGAWRSATWTKAYQVQKDVEAETIPMPTVDELIAMLPVYGA